MSRPLCLYRQRPGQSTKLRNVVAITGCSPRTDVTNESTNTRVKWFGVMTTWLLVGLWVLTLVWTIPHAYHGHLFMASSETSKSKGE